jgi:hypothetical protein
MSGFDLPNNFVLDLEALLRKKGLMPLLLLHSTDNRTAHSYTSCYQRYGPEVTP